MDEVVLRSNEVYENRKASRSVISSDINGSGEVQATMGDNTNKQVSYLKLYVCVLLFWWLIDTLLISRAGLGWRVNFE